MSMRRWSRCWQSTAIVSLLNPLGPAQWEAAGEMRLGCARRGYFSISSQVQPNEKGQYPDTYLNIGGSKWSKGVAFINGFNLVRLRPEHPS